MKSSRSHACKTFVLAAVVCGGLSPRITNGDEPPHVDAPPTDVTAPNATAAPTEAGAPTTQAAPVLSDDSLALAQAHFQAGRAAYAARDYPSAIEAFKQAGALRPSPVLDYHLGLCYEALGDRQAAEGAYLRYLSLQPDAHNRAEVEARLARLQSLGAAPMAAAPAPASTPSRSPSMTDDETDADRRARTIVGRENIDYKTQRRWDMFGAGAGIFVTLYTLNVLGASIDNANGGRSSELYIPLVGPLVYAAGYNARGSGQGDPFTNAFFGKPAGWVTAAMVFDFLGQATGVALAIAGAATKQKVPMWAVTPRLDPRFAGLSVAARF